MDHSSPAPPLPSIPVPTPSQPELPLGLSLAIEICLSPSRSRDNTRGEPLKFNAENMPRVGEVLGWVNALPPVSSRVRCAGPDCEPSHWTLSTRDFGWAYAIVILVFLVWRMEARQPPNRVINSRQMHAGTVVTREPSPWRVASCESPSSDLLQSMVCVAGPQLPPMIPTKERQTGLTALETGSVS
jgi:hypothetical protein